MVSAPSLPETAAAPAVDRVCAVCPHPLAGHDRISLRFCQATLAQALVPDETTGTTTRGCVCPSS